LTTQPAGVWFQDAPALFLPSAISSSPGGRESVLNLPLDEPTVVGIIVQAGERLEAFWTRTGEDAYEVRISRPSSGEALSSFKGTLEVVDERVGLLRLTQPSPHGPVQGPECNFWNLACPTLGVMAQILVQER
jgi:hypothetical protein